MKIIKTILTAIICLTCCFGRSQTAQVINSGGATVVWSGYTVEWSVGELSLVNYMVASDNSYQLTNGFIQPYTGKPGHVANIAVKPAAFAVFPNPTADYVTINLQEVYSGKIMLSLYNELGQLIYTDETPVHGFGFSHKINMKGFKNGTYTLYVSSQNPFSTHSVSTSKSFKIVKR